MEGGLSSYGTTCVLSLFLSFLSSFIIRCDHSALLRRRLEVLVRGVLVAVHLHARHVLLLRTRCLVHLDEALEKQADYKSDQVERQINLQRKLSRAREIQVVRMEACISMPEYGTNVAARHKATKNVLVFVSRWHKISIILYTDNTGVG